jgi:ribosomal protein S4
MISMPCRGGSSGNWRRERRYARCSAWALPDKDIPPSIFARKLYQGKKYLIALPICNFLCRLFNMGVLPTKKSLAQTDKLATAAFCRRRLSVVMVRLKMAETLREAVTFVEQGHVRVGPDTITDPAFHVTRNMEDFVTWVDTSKIRRKVLQYNDKLDDYDLLNA